VRWIFWDPSDPEEAREHARIDAAIDAWWCWFASRIPEIERREAGLSRTELEEIGTRLQAIHPELCWELGPDHPGGGWSLAITPEGCHGLLPLVRTVVERAPRLDGWRWIEQREPVHPGSVAGAVLARTGYDLAGARVSVTPGRVRRTDLRFHSQHFESSEDRAAFRAVLVAAEAALGERALDSWVGAVSVERGKGDASAIPLEELGDAFKKVVYAAQAARPNEPYWRCGKDENWFLVKRKAIEKDDYAGREDIFIAQTVDPEIAQTVVLGFPFSSECFSRHGERFIFVKFDGSGGYQAQVANRSAVEEAIEGALLREELGAQVGGATGLRYFYIDLAVTDLRRAVEVIRPQLRALELPRRSWILPMDADLSGEWIGVWDDTPPPPA